MILQALNEYYHVLDNDPETDIPRSGFAVQKIHFALVINQMGKLVQIIDLRERDGKKIIPKLMTAPAVKRSGSGFSPNFTWDNTGYVLGVGAVNEKETPEKQKKTADRCLLAFDAFKEFHKELGRGVDDDGMRALLRFYNSWTPESAMKLENWEEMAGLNVVFRLEGEKRFIHDHPAVKERWLEHYLEKSSDCEGTCLISGEKKNIARIHPDIKGVRGAQAKGAALVSFNINSFRSYNKEKNFNAPVGESEAFAYTTVLNYLLRSDTQKVQIGDASTLFWTEHKSRIVKIMGRILERKNNGSGIKDVRDYLEAVRGGKMPDDIDSDDKFYILGLSPNASRLSVRFWHVSTVGEISSRIVRHFQDLSIVKSFEQDPDYPGMWQLLIQTAVQRKSENISPLLAGAFMRSILTGSRYPQGLLVAIITRIRADHTVNYLRAAIIKACLIRKCINTISQEVTMALNREEKNIAYRLGRLFASLEKVQKEAIGANATIKDLYYGSASATPRIVFPQLLRMAQHHIKKAKYGNITDRIIEEIMQGIQDFPAHLPLDEQGLFAIGYYHQRTELYPTSPEKKED